MKLSVGTGCRAGVAGLAALLTLTACGSDSSGSAGSSAMSMSMPAGSAPASAAVSTAGKLVIKNFEFSGKLTVKAGEKVSVVNEDSAAHTVTADKDKVFDSGTIDGGATGTFTAQSKPGKYGFGCNLHPNMVGTLTVTG